MSRTAYADNSSVYHLNGKKLQFKEIAALLRESGIDLDHNRFLILQVLCVCRCVCVCVACVCVCVGGCGWVWVCHMCVGVQVCVQHVGVWVCVPVTVCVTV